MMSSGTPRAPALEQDRAVIRVADGRRCDGEDPIGAGSLSDGAEITEGLERSFDRVGAELVARAELAGEPERSAGVLNHVQVLPLPQAEHDHPGRVGTDIQDRERPIVGRRRVARSATLRCSHARERPAGEEATTVDLTRTNSEG